MGCSVVVCTDGRKSDLLVRCIESLSNQTYKDIEVICVSTIESLPEEIREKARILVERRRGVSLAKNVGILASEHDLIALTDDDCVCEPDWVENLVKEFESDSVGCVTGGSIPTREGMWYASTNWQPETKVFKKSDGFIPPWVIGAGNNISLRKDAIENLGLFDVKLGPGSRYRSAEDLDVFHRMIGGGYEVVYTPAAVVRHEPLDTNAQVRMMMSAYRFGIGAFFAKHRYSVEARRYFRKEFLRTQLRDSRNNFGMGNPGMGWTYLMGYIAALRGYYEYIFFG